MTTEIFSDRHLEYFIKDWTLVPASGGKFEVVVNDELIFSKKQQGRHAESGEIKRLLDEMVVAYKQAHGIRWDHIPEED